MKKVVLSFICLMMLGLTSCNELGDNIRYYQDVPAIVGISYETLQPTIITSGGTFLAPELQNKLYTEVMEGDAIWSYFNVNYDQPTTSGAYKAYNISFYKVEKGWTQATVGGESAMGDFNIPIEKMLVADVVGNVMFFIFEQKVPKDQQMVYELTYDSNKASEPEIYIRAKKEYPEGSEATETVIYLFAFDMYSFFLMHKDTDNWVKFKIKYKTGVDNEGCDMYSYYAEGALIEVKVD